MRRQITENIEIPQGFEVTISEHEVKIMKNGKEIKRYYTDFTAKKENGQIVLSCEKSTKKEKKLIKTLKAHINNAFTGLEKKYEYKLQICAVHFPMTVSVDKANSTVVIKNFVGEVKPRIAKILPGAEVKFDKEVVIVSGEDKEIVGQTAANIEKSVRITNKDRRTFQDGIFLVSRNGEAI